jgi:hypothetical protein
MQNPARCRRAISSVLFAATTLLSLPLAYAQDDRHPVAPAATASHKVVTVTVNPLGFAFERYGMNLELVPFRHHALVASGFLQGIPTWLVKDATGHQDINARHGSKPGGEVGYRLYSGSKGADGVFIGGSFVSMPLAYPRLAADNSSADMARISSMGGAIDIGGQKVTNSGFTIGGGIGAMYLAYDMPNDPRRLPLPMQPHVFPRLLLTAGWSF